MLDAGQDLAFRSRVATQLVGDDHPRHILQTAQQLAEEALGRAGIASALYQDIEHASFLIDGAPKVMQLAPGPDEDLIHVPLIARTGTAPLEPVGEQPAETQAPLADALVADYDAAGGQDQLDITQAEAEAVIQPDSVLDHLGPKSKATVGLGRSRHSRPAALPSRVRQPDKAVPFLPGPHRPLKATDPSRSRSPE